VVAPQPVLDALASGTLYWFRDWPNLAVPRASGVYTVWDDERLLYVGLAPSNGGLSARLRRHVSGYAAARINGRNIANRSISGAKLKHNTLTGAQIDEIAGGRLSLDALVREYIHARLRYRFAEVADIANCYALEAKIRGGALAAGPPLLNA
jgi:hypothetical protein